MNGDLLFGGFVFNSSKMKLFHFHSAARCPFYLRSTHTSKRKLSLCIDASALPLPLPYTQKRITNVPFRIAIGRRLLFNEWCFVTMPVATQRNIISPSKPFSPFAENVGSGYSFRANHSVVEPSTFSTLYRNLNNLPIRIYGQIMCRYYRIDS